MDPTRCTCSRCQLRIRDACLFMAELHLAAGLRWVAREYLTAVVIRAGGAVA